MHVDIATSVWINRIAGLCKSLRFMLIVHGATLEDELGGSFRDLMHMFSQLMKGKPLEIAYSFCVVFTHMSDGHGAELDEANVLAKIEARIKAIAKGTPSQANEAKMMKILLKFSKGATGHLRVLNPVSSDIVALKKFIRDCLCPLSDPRAFVQCSLTREASLMVQLSIDRLANLVRDSVLSCLPETLNQLPEFANLLVAFADILGTPTAKRSLTVGIADIVKEYGRTKQYLLSVVDSTVDSSTGPQRVTKGVVEGFQPVYEKFLILCTTLSQLRALQSQTVETSLQVLYTAELDTGKDTALLVNEFERKCLMIKIDICNRIDHESDYVLLFQQLSSLEELLVLGDVFVPAPAIPDLSDVLAEPCKSFLSAFESSVLECSWSLTARVSDSQFIDAVWPSLKKRCVAEHQFLYLALLKQCVLLRHKACDDPVVTVEAILSPMGSADCVLVVAAHREELLVELNSLSPDALWMKVCDGIKQLLFGVKDALSCVDILSHSGISEFDYRVERLRAYQLYQSSVAGGIPACLAEIFHAQDDDFARDIVRRFVDLNRSVLDVQCKPNFDLLAQKLKLLSVHRHALGHIIPGTYSLLVDDLVKVQQIIQHAAELEARRLVGEGKEFVDRGAYGRLCDTTRVLFDACSQFDMLLPDSSVLNRAFGQVTSLTQHTIDGAYSKISVNCTNVIACTAVDLIIPLNTLIQLDWFEQFAEEGAIPVGKGVVVAKAGCKEALASVTKSVQTHVSNLQHDDIFKCTADMDKVLLIAKACGPSVFAQDLDSKFRSQLKKWLCPMIMNYCKITLQICKSVRNTSDLSEETLGALGAFLHNKIRYCSLLTGSLDGLMDCRSMHDAESKVKQLVQKCINDKMTESILTMDVALVANLIHCGIQLERVKTLRCLVPRLYDFNGRGESFRVVVKAAVHDLIHVEIKGLVASMKGFEALENSLALLKSFAPVEELLDEPVTEMHTLYMESMVANQSGIHNELRQRLGNPDLSDLTGVCEYLDRVNVKDNDVLASKYRESMDLLVGTWRVIREGAYARGGGSGSAMKRALDVTAAIRTDGSGKHMLAFADIDIDVELTKLRALRDDFIKTKLELLRSLDCIHPKSQVVVADELEVYFVSLGKSTLPASPVDALKRFVSELRLFFCKGSVAPLSLEPISSGKGTKNKRGNVKTTPDRVTFGGSVLKLLDGIRQQKPLMAAQGTIATIATLTEVLDQAKAIQSGLKSTELRGAFDYNCMRDEVTAAVLEMLINVEKTAKLNSAFFNARIIMLFAQEQFSVSFIRHLTSSPDLTNRIEALSQKLAIYSRGRECWYDSVAGCKETARELLALSNWDYLQDIWLFLSRAQKKRRYETQKRSFQSDLTNLTTELRQALRDGNGEKVASIANQFTLVDEHMRQHLTVPVKEVGGLISDQLEDLVGLVGDCLAANDMDLLLNKFSAVHTLRVGLTKAGIFLGQGSVNKIIGMHQDLCKCVSALGEELKVITDEFQFSGVLELANRVRGLRKFIDATVVVDYCATFRTFKHNTIINYARWYASTTTTELYDISLVELADGLKQFIKPSELQKQVEGLFIKLLTTTDDCVTNHEYKKVKAIAEGLQSIHFLADLGCDKGIIESTKSEIMGIIRGHLDSKRTTAYSAFSKKDYVTLNGAIKMLKEAEGELKMYEVFGDMAIMRNIQHELELSLRKIGDEAIEGIISPVGDVQQRILDLAMKLVDLGMVYSQVGEFQGVARVQIARVLNQCRSVCGLGFLFKLGVCLKEGLTDESDDVVIGVATSIVGDFNHFKDVSTMCWNQNVSQHPVEESLSRLRSDLGGPGVAVVAKLDTDMLKRMFESYQDRYNKLLMAYIKPDADPMDIVGEVLGEAAAMSHVALNSWERDQKEAIPGILAGIFAFYTIHKCGDSYNTLGDCEDGEVDRNEILMMPHNIQIITILCLLGCGDGTTSIRSHLMQIGTGEGKSLVLGALCTVFGLLRFRVRCVCYSEYLSARDYSDFEAIFKAFHVDGNVIYGKIFGGLCGTAGQHSTANGRFGSREEPNWLTVGGARLWRRDPFG